MTNDSIHKFLPDGHLHGTIFARSLPKCENHSKFAGPCGVLDPEFPAFCCVCLVRIFDPFMRIFDPLGSLGAPQLVPPRSLRGSVNAFRSPPGPVLAALGAFLGPLWSLLGNSSKNFHLQWSLFRPLGRSEERFGTIPGSPDPSKVMLPCTRERKF